jgi:hypothetical protein
MKTNRIEFPRLRNDEHFQFHTEFRDAVIAANPETIRIAPQFDTYLALYTQLDEALVKILRSATTEEIGAADHRRDATLRGLVNITRA